ncbi:MAG: TlpA family protein disulfide reductase [Planctomycetes bacterium]|nr:TlpA family protein disulfide reductase [Planctomycetota bacterium]
MLHTFFAAVLVSVCFVLEPVTWTTSAKSTERPAAEIAADVAVAERALLEAGRASSRTGEGYKANAKHYCELVAELERADSGHADLVRHLPVCWRLRVQSLDDAVAVDAELVKRLEATPDGTLAWPARAELVRTRMHLARGSSPEALKRLHGAFEDAVARHGERRELADLFYEYAASRTDDVTEQAALLKRFVEKYPQHPRAAVARERITQLGRLGGAFEVEFVDALTGNKVSTKDLRGKVLVIDFWATWCGPCMREMPRMKELYAKFKDQGVEFLGISLDKSEAEGGKQALIDVCTSQGLTWPQYYQGKHWESEFSRSWGIRSIPAVFLVDFEGKLVTTQARGQLEHLLPRELERAKAARK